MNILFDARTAIPRFPGIGRYAAELASALAELFEKTGDTLTLIENSSTLNKLTSAKNIVTVDCDVPPDSPQSCAAINQVIEQVKPTLYHTPHRICHPIETVPTVLTIHDCIPIRCPFETTPQERVAYIASVGSALRTCTRAIAVSQTTLDDLKSLFPDDMGKCRVIHHGVNKVFKPTKPEQHAAAALSNHYKRPILLYIGNNLRHKNLVELFRGFARAKQMLHGVRLVLGGYGCTPLPRHTRLIQELDLEDFVTWIGEIMEAELPAIIGSATALVMPSLYEGFCMPVAEAMACGTPVACSDIPALREICKETVTYFNPEDPDTIAQALVTAVTDNIVRNRNRTAALDRARNFNWDEVARKTRDVYQAAASL